MEFRRKPAILLKLKVAVWQELHAQWQLAERQLQEALARPRRMDGLVDAVANARRLERRCVAARQSVQQALAAQRGISC